MTTVDGPAVVDDGQPASAGIPSAAVSGAAVNGTPSDGTPADGSAVNGALAGGVSAGGQAAPRAGTEPAAAPRSSRAGRNLPAAIGVGLILGAAILVPLGTVRASFAGVVALAVAVGTAEVVRAVRLTGIGVPLAPLVAGALAMPPVAYVFGTTGLLLTLAATMGAGVLVRVAGSAAGLLRDVAGICFVASYVGFAASFAALLTAPSDGSWRAVAFLGTVVASDVGGYAAGVLSGGRHKMAPTVSPGKSWEGFAGSVIACVTVAAILVGWPLGAEPWQGVLLGLAIACTATIGDLGESLLKRDIGIKDMGSLLPGHGGIMDRLDSLLCTAPISWLLLTAFLG